MTTVKKNLIKNYLKDTFGDLKRFNMKKIGSGVLGTGYLLTFFADGKEHRLIFKTLFTENLGKDHFSDRAGSLILAHDSYNELKDHIRSLDVCGVSDNEILSVGDMKEFFILMEEADGVDFFSTFEDLKTRHMLSEDEKNKVIKAALYLAEMHKPKVIKNADILYKRKIRDTIGGAESIISIFDMYPAVDFLSARDMAEYIKLTMDYWIFSKSSGSRLCEIHGDFHPGNIRFSGDKMQILDRARGRFGEPADDIAAFIINPIFFSMVRYGKLAGPYKEIFDIFWNTYFKETVDREMRKFLPVYLAFRITVICNPLFYNDAFFGSKQKADLIRERMFRFGFNLLRAGVFNPEQLEK